MRIAVTLCAASMLVAAGLTAPALGQSLTYPIKELEASQRDRVAMDKRMKREGDEQRRKDKERDAVNARADAATKKAAAQPAVPLKPPRR
jgi:hypothetical protein